MKPVLPAVLALAIVLGCASPSGAASRGERPSGARLSVPVEYHKLDNGLRVVLSPDRSVADGRRRASTTASASGWSRRTAPASRTSSST